MKKFLVSGIVLLVAVAVAAPAMAKVDFSYGGVYRMRAFGQSNFAQIGDGANDDRTRFDQRMRLYFTYTASENLKLVTKLEIGDVVWGRPDTTGRVGADGKDVEVKNMYVDFNIPNGMFPLNAKVGTQGLVFFDSWIIDDDFSGAYLSTKLDATKIGLGYVAAQRDNDFGTEFYIDDFFMHVDYTCNPWFASFMVYAQAGHDTAVSADPATLNTPVVGTIPRTIDNPNNYFRRAILAPNYLGGAGAADFAKAGHNNLIDLGLQVKYKTDVWSGYLTFVKNLGSVDFKRYVELGNDEAFALETVTSDYTGWMVDAGASYYCGPWTFNLGGFYTTGPESVESSFRGGRPNVDVETFTYPLATSKYFSEILGGGIFDNTAPAHEDAQWRGYGFPTNLWTVNLGAAWQVMPATKLAFSYWYFSTSEDVVSDVRATADGLIRVDLDNSIGHEFNLNVTQKIVDGLMLDLVAAYLIADDAFSITNDDEDAIELGARLQWSF